MATPRHTSGVTTRFVYDEGGNLLGQYDNAGNAIQQYVWMEGVPVGVLTGSGTSQVMRYVQTDQLGTPRAVVDPTQQRAVWRWDESLEAFGDTAPNTDPDGNGQQFVFDLRFPGQRYDAASGLHYNYFRDYDPNVGRYTQSDPIGLAGGISVFAYVGGNPLTSIDRLGLFRTGQGLKSGLGMAGDGAGVAVGLALLAAPTGITQVIGLVILAKSVWGLTANTYNFARAFSDDSSYDLADKYNSPTRAIADWIAPCSEGAQRIADAADLSLDLVGGRAVFKSVNYGGYLRQPVGYPYVNKNPIIMRTTDTLAVETLPVNTRIATDVFQGTDTIQYVTDAYPGLLP